MEIPKQADFIIDTVNSSLSSPFSIGHNLKAVFDSNAILKDDALLFTNGLISHSQKVTQMSIICFITQSTS